MTGILEWFAWLGKTGNAQFFRNSLIRFCLGSEKTELAVTSSQTAGKWIFHDGSKHGIGHHKTALTSSLKTMSKDAEGVGISLEMGDVVPKLLANLVFNCKSCSFSKKGLDGFFT